MPLVTPSAPLEPGQRSVKARVGGGRLAVLLTAGERPPLGHRNLPAGRTRAGAQEAPQAQPLGPHALPLLPHVDTRATEVACISPPASLQLPTQMPVSTGRWPPAWAAGPGLPIGLRASAPLGGTRDPSANQAKPRAPCGWQPLPPRHPARPESSLIIAALNPPGQFCSVSINNVESFYLLTGCKSIRENNVKSGASE